MAYSITDLANSYASKEIIEPNLVLEIDGVSTLFAVAQTKIEARYGYNDIRYGDMDLVYGGLANDESSKALIAINGTTQNISQQLEPDKGAANSTSSLTVKLIDLNGEITQLISPNRIVDDILYRDCTLYYGMKETAFPTDYIEIFQGKIKSIISGVGAIKLVIAHPEDIKRSDIFKKAETVLTADLNYYSLKVQDLFYTQKEEIAGILEIEYIQTGIAGNSASVVITGNKITVNLEQNALAKNIKKVIENDDEANQLVSVKLNSNQVGNNQQFAFALTSFEISTEIEVNDVSQFLMPTGDDLFRTYARINDEIIEYQDIDLVNNKLLNCVRASLTSFGANHEVNDEVYSFYKLGDASEDFGNAIDLALKIMLSGPREYYKEIQATAFYQVKPQSVNQNVIYFNDIDIQRKFGTVVGDFVTITGATNIGNNLTLAEITLIEKNDQGTFIQVNTNLTQEAITTAMVKFKSQYNVLPDGSGLVPYQVDIEGILKVKNTFNSSIANFEIYLKDTVSAKDFINKNILLPSALYSLPRKGRVSIGYTSPPLYAEGTKTLNLDTIKNAINIEIERSIDRNFYNAVVWKYDEDSVEDKLLKGQVIISNNSFNRIEAPTKAFVIEAKGLRSNQETLDIIQRNTKRILARYEYGAESLNVEVPFKVGWTIEIGDTCIFGAQDMMLPDSINATRNFEPRIFEVINKQFNWKTGAISLSILDTNYSQGLRYGVLSPSSYLGLGSTSTRIKIEKSFGTKANELEKTKWQEYIGKRIKLHKKDYSQEIEITLIGFDNDPTFAIVSDIGFAPDNTYQISLLDYDDISQGDRTLKQIYCFYNPTVEILTGINEFSFTVSLSDADKLFLNSIVRVSNDDYTIDSGETGILIDSISGVQITLKSSLGFTPLAGHKVNLIGFVSDSGAPYVYL